MQLKILGASHTLPFPCDVRRAGCDKRCYYVIIQFWFRITCPILIFSHDIMFRVNYSAYSLYLDNRILYADILCNQIGWLGRCQWHIKGIELELGEWAAKYRSISWNNKLPKPSYLDSHRYLSALIFPKGYYLLSFISQRKHNFVSERKKDSSALVTQLLELQTILLENVLGMQELSG